ncbi:MAG: hypothetical protein ACP5OB_07780, partial [Candidatus Ratteibacteria bacterium]
AFSDSKGIIRFSYGLFKDQSDVLDRKGNYGFIEGLLNLTEKFYLGTRYSFVKLDKGLIANLNDIDANEYQRTSVGFGYRISKNTILKFSYDFNNEKPNDKDNDLLTVVLTSSF